MTKKEIKSYAKRLVNESVLEGKIDIVVVTKVIDAINVVPYPYSHMILEEYGKLIAIEKHKRTLTITSAYPLDRKTVSVLSDRFNKGMDFVENTINQDLIAGVRIANADHVLDLSLKREIEDLRRELL